MATYYVSRQTGNDGNSGASYSSAFMTLTRLCSIATTGDTAYVGPGVYLDNGPPFTGNPAQATLVGDPDCNVFINDSPGEVRIYEPDTVAVIGKVRIRNTDTGTVECNVYNILDTDNPMLKINTNYGIGRLPLVSVTDEVSSGVKLLTPVGLRAIGMTMSIEHIPFINYPLDKAIIIGTSIDIGGTVN